MFYKIEQTPLVKAKPQYALYWPEENVYFFRACITREMHNFRLDRNFIPRFKPTVTGVTLKKANDDWLLYEYQRLSGREIPTLALVEVNTHLTTTVLAKMPRSYELHEAVWVEFGSGLGEACKKLPKDYHPRYAITRSGKSAGLCLKISEDIVERGSKTFFTNEADIVLAKVVLGHMMGKKVYDLKPVYEKYGIDLPESWS